MDAVSFESKDGAKQYMTDRRIPQLFEVSECGVENRKLDHLFKLLSASHLSLEFCHVSRVRKCAPCNTVSSEKQNYIDN